MEPPGGGSALSARPTPTPSCCTARLAYGEEQRYDAIKVITKVGFPAASQHVLVRAKAKSSELRAATPLRCGRATGSCVFEHASFLSGLATVDSDGAWIVSTTLFARPDGNALLPRARAALLGKRVLRRSDRDVRCGDTRPEVTWLEV